MRAVDLVKKLSPGANPAYLAALEAGDLLLVNYNITTPLRMAHFLAQALAETGGMKITYENMNYSARRMLEIYGVGHHSSAVTEAEATALAYHPREIAERVYGHNSPKGKELGNTKPGDGWAYRGTGIMQTTGRYNFRKMGQLTNVDFENHPELVLSAEHALKPALAEWGRGNCNKYADNNDILSISRIINIGNADTKKIPNGMTDRQAWLGKVYLLIQERGLTFNASKAPISLPAPVPPFTPASAPVTKAPAPIAKTATTGGIVAAGGAAAQQAHAAGYGIGTIVAIVAGSIVVAVIAWLVWTFITDKGRAS